MIDNTALKPCPFCGGKAKWRYIKPQGYVFCVKCGTSTGIYSDTYEEADCKAEAVAAWNRRAEDAITGETSDGYHTFNELYHHRAVLFSVISNSRQSMAWKSRLHNDGTMYDGMFIVGINTPDGQATYHYDIDPYWDMFCVPELKKAPKWDGHTPTQAVDRIGRLSAEPANEPLTLDQLRGMNGEPVYCVDAKGKGKWALVHTQDGVCTDADFGDWEFYCYGWMDGGKLNENGWLAYKGKPEGGAK